MLLEGSALGCRAPLARLPLLPPPLMLRCSTLNPTHLLCPSRPPPPVPQPVLGSVLPLRDENLMKCYLLWPGQRGALLAQHGGRSQLVPGAAGLEPLLQVCAEDWLELAFGEVSLQSYMHADSLLFFSLEHRS